MSKKNNYVLLFQQFIAPSQSSSEDEVEDIFKWQTLNYNEKVKSWNQVLYKIDC